MVPGLHFDLVDIDVRWSGDNPRHAVGNVLGAQGSQALINPSGCLRVASQPHQAELAGRVIDHVLPFGVEDAAMAAELFNRTGRRRGSLADCMVAATALIRGAPPATANPADFRRPKERGLELCTG